MHQSTVPIVPSTLDATVTLPSDMTGLDEPVRNTLMISRYQVYGLSKFERMTDRARFIDFHEDIP